MRKAKKTGIVAMGTIVAAGLAMGATSATVFAAEAEQPVIPAAEADASETVNVAEAESAVRNAETEMTNAESAVVEAEANTATAEAEAAQAEQDLQVAVDLQSGATDIRDTSAYQDAQEAEMAMADATAEVERAESNLNQAQQEAVDTEVAAAAAESELDAAVDALTERDSALAAAEEECALAEAFRQEALEAYEQAAAEATSAAGTLADAEEGAARADQSLTDAEQSHADAEAQAAIAQVALDDALQETAHTEDPEITNAEEAASAAREEVAAAQTALDQANARYQQGTLGFIDWMAARDGLSKEQRQDLQYAREALEYAMNEDFSHWYGGDDTGLPEERNNRVVVIGDERDATTLENLLQSIDILKRINELRAADDNYTGDLRRNPSYTNFFFMATAETGAMRGAGLMRHSRLTTSCENLAFGYSDPTVGWYTREKATFDQIRDDLGITAITSTEDLARISREADARGEMIGHYTNLMWAADQVMGVGVTQYYRTSCYNASSAENYMDDSYNRAMHLYTVEEFEQLAQEYYRSVNKTACEEDLSRAVAAQTEAENRLQMLREERQTSDSQAVQAARDELAVKEEAARIAAVALGQARQAVSDAAVNLENARTAKAEADQAAAAAQAAFTEAEVNSRIADTSLAYTQAERDAARQAVEEASLAMQDALAAKKEAQTRLLAGQEALASARETLAMATAAHETAAAKLAAFSSEYSVENMQSRKDAADQAVVDAKTALEAAVRNREAAAERLAEAVRVFDVAKEREAAAAEARAAEKRAAETRAAETRAAEERIAEEYAGAADDRDEDPVIVAGVALEQARAALEAVIADPESTDSELEAAHHAYISAWANAVVEQDRAEQNQAARGRAQQDPAGQGRVQRDSAADDAPAVEASDVGGVPGVSESAAANSEDDPVSDVTAVTGTVRTGAPVLVAALLGGAAVAGVAAFKHRKKSEQ